MAREALLGSWYGDKTLSDGTRQQWVTRRDRDGTYLINFRRTAIGGTVDEWSEVGIWGVRLPIYFTAMRGFIENGKIEQAYVADPSLYDAYQVEALTVDSFTYYSFSSGNRFTVKKVARDFKLDAQLVAPADLLRPAAFARG